MRSCGAKASNAHSLHIFGQLGYIPYRTLSSKLKPRAQVVRYLHRLHPNHLLVELENGKTQRVRSSDFRPYDPYKDPKLTTAATFHSTDNSIYDIEYYKSGANAAQAKAFKIISQAHMAATKQHSSIPKSISSNTPPPKNKAQSFLYPDAVEWMLEIYNELDKIDKRWSVDCNEPDPDKNHRPISFTVNFEYKRDKKGQVLERKSRFSLRGDLILPNIHYDTRMCSAPMADKSKIRMIIFIAADRKFPV